MTAKRGATEAMPSSGRNHAAAYAWTPAHGRHAATTSTATARVDLDRSRCARLGVAPCRMARMVLTGLVDTAALLRRACLRNAKTRSYWPAHDPQILRHSGEQVPPDQPNMAPKKVAMGIAKIAKPTGSNL